MDGGDQQVHVEEFTGKWFGCVVEAKNRRLTKAGTTTMVETGDPTRKNEEEEDYVMEVLCVVHFTLRLKKLSRL